MSTSLFKQNNFDLLWQLIKTNFKMRYQNSLLGVLWVLIKPYSTFIVLYFLWSRLGQQIENYSLYLLLGIIFFTYFQELIVYGQIALLEKAHIILKVNFPRQIAIVSAQINALVSLVINMVLIIAIIFLLRVPVTVEGILAFLVLVLITFFFALGISFFLSILTVRLRDLKNIVDLGLFLLYWATPVFYKLDANLLGTTTTDLIKANPLTFMLSQVRAAMGIEGIINWGMVSVYLLSSTLLLCLGWWYFQGKVKQIAEYF